MIQPLWDEQTMIERTHFHHDFSLTGQEKRPKAQTPRSDRGEQEGFQARMGDWTPGREGVGCGAGWSGQDESIGLKV